MSSGSETLANSLLPSLIDSTPPTNLVVRPTNEKLSTGAVDGTGTFEVLMRAVDASLQREYSAGRITGAEYAKAYVALTEAALGNAVQFLLGQENAYWQAMAQQAAYALAKAKIATEDVTFGSGKFTLDNILPKQLQLATEQAETQRAQTSDTRLDGNPVTGVLGKQKSLYTQQITSYQRDAENKTAKIFSDAWIAMKTIDEGLVPPTGFTNASLDTVLSAIKTNNGLV